MGVARAARAGRLALLSAVSALALPMAGCGDECVDADGDGYGSGCERGADCDDDDAEVHVECEEPDCEQMPFAAGCPCLTGSRRDCFEGDDPEAAGVGVCQAGRQTCIRGVWTSCRDQIVPTLEGCNGEDDDCDGLTDEGALSPCGGCNAQCRGGVWGSSARPFEASETLAVTPAGELTLAREEVESVTVWVPNTGEGTLSKVDAEDAVELARYDSGGASPERVAVDFNGDAWVLNRSFDGQSTLTKVAGDVSRCVDHSGDGVQTSAGPLDVLPPGEDDCVLFTRDVGAPGEVARALAIDGTRAPDGELGGHVWIGLAAGETVLQLDGETGELLQTVPVPGVSAFASVFDPWGVLWVLDRAGVLARIDPSASQPSVEVLEAQLSCYQLEALASDADGRLTLSGFSCENVIRYDPESDHWRDVKTDGVLGTRGVAVLDGETWVAHTSGSLSRVRHDPLAILDTHSLADDSFSPLESTAVAADSLGQVWVVSSSGGPQGVGLLTRFDPSSEEVTAQVPVGRAPRGLGDLTGAFRLGEFAPQGRASHVFEGCGIGPPTQWLRLHLAWAAGPGASVLVELRHAPDVAALADADYERVGSLPADQPPFDLTLPEGGVVEVRLTLAVEGRTGAPRIARVGLEWHCRGPD